MSSPLEVAGNEMEQQVQGAGWGKRLREIREANNISLEEVVAELRLEPKLLQQIEAEDIDQLPSAPFVKGYLRNYARMLNVDAAPILESYGQVCGADAPGLTNVSRVRELTSRDTAPRSTTWIIVAVLIVSVLVWWWSQIVSFKNSAEEAAVVPEQEQSEPVAMADVASGNAMIELALPDQPAQQPQQPDATAATTTAVTAVAPEQKPESKPEPKPESRQATITLKFSQDSWVDISDATGAHLFMDLAKADNSRTVTGQPPFNVLLGNSPAVTIEYNGSPYDHRVHASKGIARFTLGAAE